MKYEDIAFERAYILEYAPAIDLQRYLGVNKDLMDEKLHPKDAIKQPTGKEWEALRARSKALDTKIFGQETMPSAPISQPITAAATPEQLYIAVPGVPAAVAATAVKPAITPFSEKTKYGPQPWNFTNTANVTRPTVDELFGELGILSDGSQLDISPFPMGMFPSPLTLKGIEDQLPKEQPVYRKGYGPWIAKYEPGTGVWPGENPAKEAIPDTGEQAMRGTAEFDPEIIYGSADFYEAVQSIVIDVLDRGNER